MNYPKLGLYIGGRWIDSGRDTVEVLDPATGRGIGLLPLAGPADLDAALEAAGKAFALWRDTPAIERGRILLRAVGLLRERSRAIAQTLTLEQGKPLSESLSEILRSAENIEFMAHEGLRAYGRVIPSRKAGVRQTVLRQPLGVVAAFAAWNFPAITPGRKIAGALASGCTCILKASEEVPGTAVELVRAFHDAGVPPGVLNLVFGDPAMVSAHLIASPVVRKVTFTGSTLVGRLIGEMAGRGIKPVTLELGGHAPTIVRADADPLRTAAMSAAAKFRNAGQICVSPTRFIVHESLHDAFANRFAEVAKSLIVGNGLDEGTQMGPMANSRRIDAMQRLVEDAVSKGARLLAGGQRLGNAGYFWQPTVLDDVPGNAAILREEPFGPVAAILRHQSDDEAVSRANSLDYGLASYLFTDSAQAQTLYSERLNTGMLGINTFTVGEPETPWGGVLDSGFGREGGQEGLDGYLSTRFVAQATL